MLTTDKDGWVVDPKVTIVRRPNLAHGRMLQVRGIVVHQTGAPTAQSSLNSYLSQGANGEHFLIDKDGTIFQTGSVVWKQWHVVGRAASIALACLVSVSTLAAPQSFGIRSVHVERVGLWREDPNGRQTADDCARFQLSHSAALRWFRDAREVTEKDWLERSDWTQCSATGSLITFDGRTYSWELDQAGRGRISMSPTVSVFLTGSELPATRKR